MVFLLLFLDFIFEEREITWLSWLERPLAMIVTSTAYRRAISPGAAYRPGASEIPLADTRPEMAVIEYHRNDMLAWNLPRQGRMS